MLAASREAAYISEPLNVLHRPGVLREPTDHWYTYICEDNQSRYLAAFQETLRFQYHPWLELQSIRSIKDLGRMLRDLGRFINGRMSSARPLLKDPFAVFSAPWFAERLGCQVVIAVRHPLAFVSSLKRLGWRFDFQDFLAQPLLIRDHLTPFREDMLADPGDVIAQGSCLWRMIYTVVQGFRDAHPEFVVVRHEDLSRQPESGFRDLYGTLGLRYTPKVQAALVQSSQRGNPDELSAHRVHSVRLDSQANLSNWKKRLTSDEIERIRALTTDTAAYFYSQESWE
jgi:hypothetical protein